jgi:hypothetical protein
LKRKENEKSKTEEKSDENQWSPPESILGQADPELFVYLEVIDPKSKNTEEKAHAWKESRRPCRMRL